MGLLYPELLLLAVPAVLAWRRWGGGRTLTGLVRALMLGLLVLAGAGPYLPLANPGHDVVVVVDRSLSMPSADGRLAELLRLVEEGRGPGDRVGVVLVGASARVQRGLSAAAMTSEVGALDPSLAAGSDLTAGLETALSLLPPGRAGRLLLVSDGRYDGRDPTSVARRAGAQGVAIDVRTLSRPAAADLAVVALEAPSDVSTGEPFALTAWIQSDTDRDARFTLTRGETPIRQGTTRLKRGTNRLILRDILEQGGVSGYALRLDDAGDAFPEDDVGRAAVRASGTRPMLVLTTDGAPSALTRALTSAGLTVDMLPPESAPRDLVGLSRYRAVVLENVEASRLGLTAEALEGFVAEQGGGLLITGGRASFGVGGYYASGLDPLLPVSMEMRVEQRKQALALVVAMDRSGSMAMPVDGGRTKMDLANLGAAEAIRLLSPLDSVGVLAVDTAAHEVVPLQEATDTSGMIKRVLRVQSEGGGIYVRTAIVGAAKQLESAPQLNRHITLFADAADSEEQEGALALADKLVGAGVTITVIALGSKFDSDAKFLEELAAHGKGTVAFTMRPTDLPRLFAQDTLLASKSTMVEDPVKTQLHADLRSLGLPQLEAGPLLHGYNLTYVRPGSLVGLSSDDDNKAPVLAWRQAGAGRTAAFTGQVGGDWGQGALGWSGFSPTFGALARWLVAAEAPQGWFASASREGQEAVIRVEREPGTGGVSPTARLRGPDGHLVEVELRPTGPDAWEGRARLAPDGVTLGAVAIGTDAAIPLPPLAAAWPAELAPPVDPTEGERVMRRIASASGGTSSGPLDQLFEGEISAAVGRVLTRALAGVVLGLLVLEIAGRRLWAWESRALRWPASRRASPRPAAPPSVAPARATPEIRSSSEPTPVPNAATTPPSPAAPQKQDAPAAPGGVADALNRARKAADRDLKR